MVYPLLINGLNYLASLAVEAVADESLSEITSPNHFL